MNTTITVYLVLLILFSCYGGMETRRRSRSRSTWFRRWRGPVCPRNYCANGGACRRMWGRFFLCHCPLGFTGRRCEYDIDDCANCPCGDYGHCTDKVHGYECRCSPGFTGTNCEIDVDDCVDKPCGNNGRCVDVINGFCCKCDLGFTGELCDEDINYCALNLCENNGICQEDVNSFNCLCNGTGFAGKLCECNIDCASNPCGENGQCVDEGSGFNCTCDKGFSGTNCEIENTIRLVGGDFWGRLEVKVFDTWGTVCDDDFDQIDAVVACKTLQLPFYRALVVNRYHYGTGIGPIWLDDVECVGNETDIRDCPANLVGEENCAHNKDVGILCLGDVPEDNVKVRLVGGPSPLEGRLEVFYNEEWGTVCDDGFREDQAKVVCRMLGVTDVTNATFNKNYPVGTGLVWVSGIFCIGNESSIVDCNIENWGDTDCVHEDDVSVKC